jgi:hypothetical protein
MMEQRGHRMKRDQAQEDPPDLRVPPSQRVGEFVVAAHERGKGGPEELEMARRRARLRPA